ncbi:hypothetical protein [Mesorhizobium sp. dw_380]|uniref:hypothetical protein n=1 Tax=Mesorhizobium sp. dw_380 TaxID=2812001 RepID=UPI002032BFDA|nr:hypothetical protein [Mesorhizobium sp. dw_380]
MNKADEARESGVSRGVDRATRYVLDIIPESAGPRRATARGSIIYSIPSPALSELAIDEFHFAEAGLEPLAFGRGDLRVDAAGSITNCFSGEQGGQPGVELHLGIIRRPDHAA